MNKKGFLLAETTLKVVIAVIGIGFLIFLLVSIYMSNQNSKDLELAKASLEHLVEEVNAEITEVEIYNPRTGSMPLRTFWYLFTWPTGGDSISPLSCSNLNWEHCVCICGVGSFKGWSKQGMADICDEKGICLKFTDLKLNKNNGFFSQGFWGAIYTSDDLIGLKDMPLELNIDYQNKEITEK